jgi:osmotically-inducible protein OsmY
MKQSSAILDKQPILYSLRHLKNVGFLMRYVNYIIIVAAFGSLQGCFPLVAVGGVGAGAMIAADRRTTGAYIEDEGIELKATNQTNQKYKDTAHVNFASFNRHILITGEAPNEEAKADIAKIVASVVMS